MAGTGFSGLRATLGRAAGLAGEDRADEFRIWMAPPPKIADNSIDVERRAAAGGRQGTIFILEEQPAGRSRRSRHSRAARIQRPNPVNETIGGDVSMAADNDIGIASSEQLAQLLIADARFDPWTVVGPG